jgi:hypothetical protein
MLVGPSGTHVVELNPVGSVVWGAIDGTRTVADLVSAVRAELNADERVSVAQIEGDVQAFLDELRRLELVQP